MEYRIKRIQKRKKSVKKQHTFSTGLKSSENQMSKNQRKRKKSTENQVKINSGLSPDEQEMLNSSPKRKKVISKSSSILKSNGKSIAISARNAGRQRLRQVTRWDTSDADTANDALQQNPGMFDRSRFQYPTYKLKKIDQLDRLRKAEIESHAFKGICLITYPDIDSYKPDLKAFCQSMKNQLNAVDCAKLINSKAMSTWDVIDEDDYLQEP